MKDKTLKIEELGKVIGGYCMMNPAVNAKIDAENKRRQEEYEKNLVEFNKRFEEYKSTHGGKEPEGVFNFRFPQLGMDRPIKPIHLVG